MSPTYIHMAQYLLLLQTLPLICVTTSVLLTPINPSENGASVQLIKGVTDYAPFEWDIYAMDEIHFHMKIHLNKSWSFDPQYITTLTFQINSDTTPDTSHTSLLVSFSQNNAKYITSVIQIGVDNDDHLIYPPPYNGKQSYGEGNIEQLVSTHNTLDRVSKATNNGSYGYFHPYTLSPNISYPLTFTLQNHPNFNYMIFTYSNPSASPRHVIYYGIDTSQTLDIYLSAADKGDNFDITSFNITHDIASKSIIQKTPVIIDTTLSLQPKHTSAKDMENIQEIDWFKTALVIILVSTVVILCCLCCLFGIMFTKILTNHKKMIQTKHVETINKHKHISTSQTSVNIRKSDTNTDKALGIKTKPIVKTEIVADIVMTMTPPIMANILGVSPSTPASQNSPQSDGINIIYKEFTRDRLHSDGEVEAKQEINETDDDDLEDMYVNKPTPQQEDVKIIHQELTRDIMDSDGEEEKKETDTDSDELQDMFGIPSREDIDRIRMMEDANSTLSESAQCVIKSNLQLNLKDIISCVSVAEGTTSPYASPTLQYGSSTVNGSITPYAINEYPITI